MTKRYDALYGEVIEDPLGVPDPFEVKERADPDQLVRILKSRAEGYFTRSEEMRADGKNSMAETYAAVCRELTYLAKEVAAGNLDDLEAKGRK